MAEKSFIIVESPSKAKTINKYLGKEYVVEASVGHIKNLKWWFPYVPDLHPKYILYYIGINELIKNKKIVKDLTII